MVGARSRATGEARLNDVDVLRARLRPSRGVLVLALVPVLVFVLVLEKV